MALNRLRWLFAGSLWFNVACHQQGGDALAPRIPPGESRVGSDGATHAIPPRGAKLTVLEFFSGHCPCQTAHDARLRELALAYGPRGVAFFGVDSEVQASAEADGREAAARGYVYPILIDTHGGLARALGATYATYAVVLDADGRVLYAGGIDSDKSHLTDGATWHLRNALDDALAARPLAEPRTHALGCALTLE